MSPRYQTWIRYSVLLGALSGAVSGCAVVIPPLLAGGVVAGTALTVTDRRTSGIQVEDKAIDIKVSNRLKEAFGDKAHINVNVYNLRVLLTGEVSEASMKDEAEKIAAKVDNVRAIVNDLAVMWPSTTTQRANDSLLTTKVKAAFVDEKKLSANAFHVTTERGVVYLMGRVTELESRIAAEVASRVSGVQRVVKVMELISDKELAEINAKFKAEEPATKEK
ncbi:BON domain-containing protein [Parvibium lacunae]|uniref:BON domain-containing protein n=1 Tax=Parvibium lacunae TaxID=1888893 RepID=A0A368L0I6_9BURK|nr:BON domain-containing protein [Parvibium lacunae]RCS57078.1 BON domain-containing protein [Parvibium lacunae]